MRRAESSVGVGDVRGLHMSGVLWEAPRAGSPQEVREEEGRDITLATTSCAFATSPSFVRSTTMDKWKDSELEKMKVTAHSVWWSPQADSPPSPSPPSLSSPLSLSLGWGELSCQRVLQISGRHDSRDEAGGQVRQQSSCPLPGQGGDTSSWPCPHALNGDPSLPQISALSEGRSWSIETSSARHHKPPTTRTQSDNIARGSSGTMLSR